MNPLCRNRFIAFLLCCKIVWTSPDFGLSVGRGEHFAQLDEAPVQHIDLGYVRLSVYLMDVERIFAVPQKHPDRLVHRIHDPVFPHPGLLVQVQLHQPVVPKGWRGIRSQ